MNSESENEVDDMDETRIKELEKDEPLLKDNPGRFVILPIQYHDIWAFYKKAVGKFLAANQSNAFSCTRFFFSFILDRRRSRLV